MYYKYRNKDARHKHELETKRTISNLQQHDRYVTDKKRLSNHMMSGANNTSVDGAGKQSFMDKVIEQNGLNKK
jgi:DNA-binding transcriptional regulator/RsmH inhibitor MraZ